VFWGFAISGIGIALIAGIALEWVARRTAWAARKKNGEKGEDGRRTQM
jgi:hypothetical protein